MRKLLIGLAVLFSSPILFILALHIIVPLREWLFPFDVWASSDCTRQQLGVVPAPDRQMEAQVFKIFCTGPLAGFFGVMADYTTIVLVKPGQAPSLDNTVLNVISNWQTMEQIQWTGAIEWKSARQVQITLPDQVSVSPQNTAVSGVAADTRLVPAQIMARQIP